MHLRKCQGHLEQAPQELRPVRGSKKRVLDQHELEQGKGRGAREDLGTLSWSGLQVELGPEKARSGQVLTKLMILADLLTY